mgnify:CR=1 FL=1
MYYLPQPPFLVALTGIFIALTFGTAFQNLIYGSVTERMVTSEDNIPVLVVR